MSLDSFGSRATITVDGRAYTIYRLDALNAIAGSTAAKLPVTLKVLLENLLRNEDDAFVKRADIETLAKWDVKAGVEREIAFRTSRVLLQDFTGVPAVVDLAAMRDAIASLGGDPGADQPAAARRSRDRSLGAGGRVRKRRGVSHQRGARVRSQSRALRISALGAERVPEFPRRAARHRDRAPDQSRISGAGRVHGREERRDASRIRTRSSAPTRTRR